MARRSFQRAGESERRQDLINATLASVAEHGLEGATVRDIAARAGVTGGLIRHYFAGKDQMLQAAYREILSNMTRTAIAAAEDAQHHPRVRLHDFIVANVSPPVTDPAVLSMWAAFISRVRVDEELARIHRENYLTVIAVFEHLLAEFLAAEGRKLDAVGIRSLAIAINGLIDGLWLEGSMASDLFVDKPLSEIALDSVEAMLGGISLRRSF